MKVMLINISNAIGWKRTKMFEGLMQEISKDELFYLRLIYRLPKLGAEEIGKVVKVALSNVDSLSHFSSTCLLWKILLKPSNLKTLVMSSTEYTQLLVVNSLVKCIQHDTSDQRLINVSIILLHQILNEVFF